MSRRENTGPQPLPSGMPRSVLALACQLQWLPGVGERTAQRFALALAAGDKGRVRALADAIYHVMSVCACARCGGLSDVNLCDICKDTRRDDALLCVVGRQADLMAIERSGSYRGRYFVLGLLLNPLEGVGMDQLPMARLRLRLAMGVQEVILALPSSVEGSATALAMARELQGVRCTRIAQGVSAGADLEYADPVTLTAAIVGRATVT